MMDLRRTTFLFACLSTAPLAFVGCSDEETNPDAGTTQADAAERPDVPPFMLPDASRPDAQTGRDAARADTGPECAMGTVTVEGTAVTVGMVTERPQTRSGDAVLTCSRLTAITDAPLRVVSCVEFMGARPTRAELDTLDIDVYLAVDPDTQMPVDPTYDRDTRIDRAPATARLTPSVEINDNAANCPSRVEIVLGRNSNSAQVPKSDVEFIIRTRSATTGAGAVWADQYHYGLKINSDQLEMGGAQLDLCNPQNCSGRVDLTLARRTALQAFATASGRAVPGIANLSDHVGAGHAFVQLLDCSGQPMTRGVAGFAPVPAATSYLTDMLAFDAAAMQTTASGGLLGLGFTGTTSTAPARVTVGAAVAKTGECAQAWSGQTLPVHPDALSTLRLGRPNLLD